MQTKNAACLKAQCTEAQNRQSSKFGEEDKIPPCNDDDDAAAAAPESSSSAHG
jgi:hypothetical protein